jgi:RNA polymerase sigma factor (sigma-70 family)
MDANNESKRNGIAVAIESYREFLALEPGPHERRKQLIEEVVEDCNEQYRGKLCAVIKRILPSREDAEGLVQEILMRWVQALEAGRKLPKPEKLTAFFKRAARNAAISHLRRIKGGRMEAEIEVARHLAAVERKRPSNPSDKELLEVIYRILERRATPKMRQIFNLRKQGLTYQEIAEKLPEKNSEAVRNVNRQVLEILREELKRLELSIR